MSSNDLEGEPSWVSDIPVVNGVNRTIMSRIEYQEDRRAKAIATILTQLRRGAERGELSESQLMTALDWLDHARS